MNKRRWVGLSFLGLFGLAVMAGIALGAYSSHQNDQDIANFLQVYPFAKSTKLDDCSLCHPGGYVTEGGKTTYYGSCDYCHITYGLQPPHAQPVPLNAYGTAYMNGGRSQQALRNIEALDSDLDGFDNLKEIRALSFPGDKKDYPGLVAAPTVLFNQCEIGLLPRHKQFLLLNTTKSGDFYAQYAGPTIWNILRCVKIRNEATQITVFAPDGFSKTFPLDAADPQAPPNFLYDVWGPYPKGIYYSGLDFVQYPAQPIYPNGSTIPDVLALILANKRDGAPLTPGKLIPDPNNPARLVLEGEGPFRLVVPQKVAGGPDRPSTVPPVGDGWDYDRNKDHNAGACVRSVAAIRVEPLPPGTTDFPWTEGGWNLVDQGKLVVYGAIDPITCPIRGLVVDKKWKPVPGVQISFGLLSMGQVGSATTGSDGRFRKDLPIIGDYIVIPSKAGYTFKPTSVQIDYLSRLGTFIVFIGCPTSS